MKGREVLLCAPVYRVYHLTATPSKDETFALLGFYAA
jgi:hypothetical protein